MRQSLFLIALLVILNPIASSRAQQNTDPDEINYKLLEAKYNDLRRSFDHLETELELSNKVRDERLEALQDLLRLFGVISGAILVVMTIKEVLHRRFESSRQTRIDDMVKGLVGLQKNTLQLQNKFGEMFVGQAEGRLELQTKGLTSVNEVISVVKETLEFRLEQEKNVAEALRVGEKMQKQFTEREKRRYERAIELSEGFYSLSRMDFSNLPDEFYKRGSRLREKIDDLQDSLEEVGTPLTTGNLYYISGVLAFYDNDISEAARYLSLSLQTRAVDHEAQQKTDSDYKYRFAFTHFFRALIEKNWGTLHGAQEEINSSHELTKSNLREFLTPITRVEIHSYIPGGERSCRDEISEILKRFEEVETAEGRLDANQQRLRIRLLLLLGNTYYVLDDHKPALSEYTRALGYAPDDYYVLSSIALAMDKLNNSEATSMHERCLDSIEQSGVIAQKKELGARVLLNWMAGISAKATNNHKKAQSYSANVQDLLRPNLTFDGKGPQFFSPLTKRLLDGHGVLEETDTYV